MKLVDLFDMRIVVNGELCGEGEEDDSVLMHSAYREYGNLGISLYQSGINNFYHVFVWYGNISEGN